MLHCCCLQTMEIVCRLDPSSSSLRCPGGGGGTATIQVIYIYKMTTYLCIALIWSYIFSELSLFRCKYKHESIKAIWNIIRYVMLVHIPMPSSYLPVMQLKFQSCFEIKSRRIIMCVRQVFCQWFIIFYWSECPSWFVIIYSFM